MPSTNAESTIVLLASTVLSGMEGLYLATHSTVVTVLGAVLAAVLALAVVIVRKNAR